MSTGNLYFLDFFEEICCRLQNKRKEKNNGIYSDEIKAQIETLKIKIESLEKSVQMLGRKIPQTTPERKALADKLREIRKEYGPKDVRMVVAKNLKVQALRQRLGE